MFFRWAEAQALNSPVNLVPAPGKSYSVIRQQLRTDRLQQFAEQNVRAGCR